MHSLESMSVRSLLVLARQRGLTRTLSNVPLKLASRDDLVALLRDTPAVAPSTSAAIGRAFADAVLDSPTFWQRLDERLSDQRPLQLVIGGAPLPTLHAPGSVPPLLATLADNLASREHSLLIGPPGCGKTTLAERAASLLSRPFSLVNLAGGRPASDLIGRYIPSSSGGMAFQETAFLHAARDGGIVCLDEIDAADPDTLVAISSVLAPSATHYHSPYRDQPPFPLSPDFAVVACANSWGGATLRHTAGQTQDLRISDRFAGCILTVDYDDDFERSVAALHPLGPDYLAWALSVRAACVSRDLQRYVSTRSIIRAVAHLCRGRSLATVQAETLATWTDEERSVLSACGVAL